MPCAECSCPTYRALRNPWLFALRHDLLCPQGTGIGRALMNQAIQTTQEQGYTRLLLGVHGENHDAVLARPI